MKVGNDFVAWFEANLKEFGVEVFVNRELRRADLIVRLKDSLEDAWLSISRLGLPRLGGK